MKTLIALTTAAVLFSSAALSDTVGTYRGVQANSDILVAELTDAISNHPYCKGKKEVLSHLISGSMNYKLAKGCWDVVGENGDKFIAVEMYAYSDGREISFPIAVTDLQFTTAYADKFAQFPTPTPVSAKVSTAAPKTQKLSVTDFVALGSCLTVQEANDVAKSVEEKAFAKKLKANLAKGLDLKDAELFPYCFDLLKSTKQVADAQG